MDHEAARTAALTIAFAAAAGIISQSLARSIHLPGIVILLLVGVLLGPDGVGVIQPSSLGVALPQLVSFAVAVILFEGGMHLKLERFRKQNKAIRRLITLGALITMVGGTLAAKWILGWQWRASVLFGSLVIVTGPTVVSPLVRRFRLIQPVRTVLEAEGILIDAIGAVVAVVALEVALEPSGMNVALGVLGVATRLGFGVLAGLVGGLLLWVLLRYRGLVADGLENVFTLALIWALYQASDAVTHESGIAAVTVAGLVVGNLKTARHRELLEFNDQLTVMLIGMLFVLLAAHVSLDQVHALGVRGLITVAVLVFLIRPLSVLVCLRGTTLTQGARVFVAWIGPRGIIAAAVASLFANSLDVAGIAGGGEIKAMVFMVIAVTVTLAGLTGGAAASLLKVKAARRGWLLLSAGETACALAQCLKEGDTEVTCVDNSSDACESAQRQGIDTLLGNGLEDEVLARADINLRQAVAALTPNDEINLIFIRKAHRDGGVKRLFASLRTAKHGATDGMIRDAGGSVLFGAAHDVALWSGRLRAGEATVHRLVAQADPRIIQTADTHERFLPLARHRGKRVDPVTADQQYQAGDKLSVLVGSPRETSTLTQLAELGWLPASTPDV
jgi:NhaP-type Na+/H+ or K+/H+ antiporter/acetolactate synthase regulatory subunit